MPRTLAAIAVLLLLVLAAFGAQTKKSPAKTGGKAPTKTAAKGVSKSGTKRVARKASSGKKRTVVKKSTAKGTKKRPVKRRRGVKEVGVRPADIQLPEYTGVQCATGATSAGSAAPCMACSEQALVRANALVGLRYRRGGTSIETGFDCSGFVQHVFANSCQLDLPRSASMQYQVGLEVAGDELQRGDLVFFRSRRGWHVGIYTGDGHFIHSPNRRDTVKVSSLSSPYYKKTYLGARRLTQDLIEPLPSSPPLALSTELSAEAGLN